MLRNPNKTSESQWLAALETCSRAVKSLILRAVNASSLIKVSCPDYGDGAVGLGLVWLGARAMGRFNAGRPIAGMAAVGASKGGENLWSK